MNTNLAKDELVSSDLKNDQRIVEAKRLILEALVEHQQRISSVRPPQPDRDSGFQDLLDRFGSIRGGNLYFPYLSSGVGNGPFVELQDGSVKLDFITGIGVHGFGHSHPMLVEAGIDAALSDTVMQGNLQQGSESYEMVKLLTETANESGGQTGTLFSFDQRRDGQRKFTENGLSKKRTGRSRDCV